MRRATACRCGEWAGGEFNAADTVHEPETLLQDLPPGEFIEVRVIAANKVGEVGPSPASVVIVR